MRFHYSKKEDAFYIRFDEAPYSQSEEIAQGIIFDYDKKRRLIGIEILDASRKLSSSLRSSLIRQEIPLQIGAKVAA